MVKKTKEDYLLVHQLRRGGAVNMLIAVNDFNAMIERWGKLVTSINTTDLSELDLEVGKLRIELKNEDPMYFKPPFTELPEHRLKQVCDLMNKFLECRQVFNTELILEIASKKQKDT